MQWLKPIKRYLLQCRWLTVAVLILAGFWFEKNVGRLFQPGRYRHDRLRGRAAIRSGYAGRVVLEEGQQDRRAGGHERRNARLGLHAHFARLRPRRNDPHSFSPTALGASLSSRPEHFLGATGTRLRSAMPCLWTMLVNVGLYIACSLCSEQGQEEEGISEAFVASMSKAICFEHRTSGEADIDLPAKRKKIEELFASIFRRRRPAEVIGQCFATLQIEGKPLISLIELAELHGEVEKRLASVHRRGDRPSGDPPRGDYHPGGRRRAEADFRRNHRRTQTDAVRSDEKDRLLSRTGEASSRPGRGIGEEDQGTRSGNRRRERRSRNRCETPKNDCSTSSIFLPDATFAIDLDGRVILWNRAAEEFTGVKSEDMLGKGNYEYAIPFHGVRRPILIDLVLTPSAEIERRLREHRKARRRADRRRLREKHQGTAKPICLPSPRRCAIRKEISSAPSSRSATSPIANGPRRN